MPGNRSQACADCVNLSALPGIHVFLQARHRRQTWMASDLGLARGPHSLECRKSGKPRLAVTSTAMTKRGQSENAEVLRDDSIVEPDRTGGSAKDDASGIDDDDI